MDIVIITGGANGLGYAIIKELYKEKKYIICNLDWDNKKLEEIKKEFTQNYYSFCGDVSDEQFVIKTIEKISEIGNIKYVINNAGEPYFGDVKTNNKTHLDCVLKGLQGMIYVTTSVLKFMKDGKIANVMSSASLKANKDETIYCAVKWGERGYTESLKSALKGSNIKVIGIYPGGIDTNFYKNSRHYVTLEKQKTFMPATDVAETIIYNVFTNKNLNIADLIIERI